MRRTPPKHSGAPTSSNQLFRFPLSCHIFSSQIFLVHGTELGEGCKTCTGTAARADLACCPSCLVWSPRCSVMRGLAWLNWDGLLWEIQSGWARTPICLDRGPSLVEAAVGPIREGLVIFLARQGTLARPGSQWCRVLTERDSPAATMSSHTRALLWAYTKASSVKGGKL